MPIGKLEPFDLHSKQWPAYIRRVQLFIVLNEVKQELRVSLLITVVGEATYALMCDLCSPVHPETKTFNELVTLVTEHLEPKRSEIAERHIFRLRRQNGGESFTEYLQNLKHLASTCTCNFGATLEENLRDQFVSGLANETMRSRIFADKNIKYKEAVELALALEAAERHSEVSGATMAAAATSSAVTQGSSGDTAGEGLHTAYWPQGNGAAENAVRTIKKVIKWALHVGENVSKALCKFLFQYSNVEHATTSVPPAVALLGRRLRGRLDALRPDVAAVVRIAQERQIANKGGQDLDIGLGDPVLVRGYANKGQKWVKGNVMEKTGPVSYKVKEGDGIQWRRHQDQVICLNPSRKSRYSLSRPSLNVSKDPVSLLPDSEANDIFKDAANPSRQPSASAPPTPGLTSLVPAAARSPSLPQDASARALRAYNRAKN